VEEADGGFLLLSGGHSQAVGRRAAEPPGTRGPRVGRFPAVDAEPAVGKPIIIAVGEEIPIYKKRRVKK